MEQQIPIAFHPSGSFITRGAKSNLVLTTVSPHKRSEKLQKQQGARLVDSLSASAAAQTVSAGRGGSHVHAEANLPSHKPLQPPAGGVTTAVSSRKRHGRQADAVEPSFKTSTLAPTTSTRSSAPTVPTGTTGKRAISGGAFKVNVVSKTGIKRPVVHGTGIRPRTLTGVT